jgi:hypothetical protein
MLLVEHARAFCFAMEQAGVPLVQRVGVRNRTNDVLDGASVRISVEPDLSKPIEISVRRATSPPTRAGAVRKAFAKTSTRTRCPSQRTRKSTASSATCRRSSAVSETRREAARPFAALRRREVILDRDARARAARRPEPTVAQDVDHELLRILAHDLGAQLAHHRRLEAADLLGRSLLSEDAPFAGEVHPPYDVLDEGPAFGLVHDGLVGDGFRGAREQLAEDGDVAFARDGRVRSSRRALAPSSTRRGPASVWPRPAQTRLAFAPLRQVFEIDERA